MSVECGYSGCTVGETGICALEHDPLSCPNHISLKPVALSENASAAGQPVLNIGGSVLSAPAKARTLPSSSGLGLDAVSQLMSKRYVTLIGILGEPESGKTAALASLYLLVANGKLTGWSFSNSQSLIGFEDIARGSRDWNLGSPPAQMTPHTYMADDRQPGFLHLKLRRNTDGHCIDLALPDLPGEWTQALIRKNTWERLSFLRSADVIWLFADGRTLAKPETRQAQVLRLGQLASRLQALLSQAIPPIKLVVTHHDTAEVQGATLEQICTKFSVHGAQVEVIHIASFTTRGSGIKAGHGIDVLINSTAGSSFERPDFWPASEPNGSQRAYLAYRRDR